MAKEYWYKFIFTDGYQVWCRGMSAAARKQEERQHGKLISKERFTLN